MKNKHRMFRSLRRSTTIEVDLMRTMLLMTVLIGGGVVGAAQTTAQPCSVIAGGFTRERLSPETAIETARSSVWKAYQEHLVTCIDLRVLHDIPQKFVAVRRQLVYKNQFDVSANCRRCCRGRTGLKPSISVVSARL